RSKQNEGNQENNDHFLNAKWSHSCPPSLSIIAEGCGKAEGAAQARACRAGGPFFRVWSEDNFQWTRLDRSGTEPALRPELRLAPAPGSSLDCSTSNEPTGLRGNSARRQEVYSPEGRLQNPNAGWLRRYRRPGPGAHTPEACSTGRYRGLPAARK